jgi:phage major head subunit gpT-like protein
MGIEFNLISVDAQIALTDFRTDFELAYLQEVSPADEWAKLLGLYYASKALKTKFPIPVSAAGYSEFKGDVTYRSIFEKSFELVPKTWQDGVAELASVVEAPDFIGWPGQAAAMASAARSLPNEIISGLLESNAVHPLDGLTFFNASHPVNLFDVVPGTFANTFTGAGTAASTTALETAKANIRKIKAANGKPMGLRMTHVLAHPDREESWRNILDRDLIIESIGANNFGTVNNRHKGSVQLIVSDQFTVSAQWYALALNKPGMYPWVVQDAGAPETIIQDKTDALYKASLQVGMASILRGNGGLALPHCIHRYVGA